jgi:hypothetical protein
MTVLVAEYSDEWQIGHQDTKIFADTKNGLKKAIDWIEFHILYDKEYLCYYKNAVNKISDKSRENIIHNIKAKGGTARYDCSEYFMANFDFYITREEVEE